MSDRILVAISWAIAALLLTGMVVNAQWDWDK